MRKYLAISLVTILLLVALAGCASASTQSDKNSGVPATTTTAGLVKSESGGVDLADEAAAERKMVRNATLDLEAKDVAAVYADLLAYAGQFSGYEVYRNQQRSDSYLSIDAQIKINPEQLDAFIEYAGTLADVINTNITSSDITEAYYDAETRLNSMEKSLDRYYVFLDDAANIEESLAVQSQINQLTVEIESLKGKLKLWDSQLAESVVTIRLRQIDDPVKLKKEINWSALTFADMAYLMQSGLAGVVNVLVGFFQWLAIILVAVSPIWVPSLVIILVILRNRKKKRKQAEAARQSAKQRPPA